MLVFHRMRKTQETTSLSCDIYQPWHTKELGCDRDYTFRLHSLNTGTTTLTIQSQKAICTKRFGKKSCHTQTYLCPFTPFSLEILRSHYYYSSNFPSVPGLGLVLSSPHLIHPAFSYRYQQPPYTLPSYTFSKLLAT